jgi:hypothetical protein
MNGRAMAVALAVLLAGLGPARSAAAAPHDPLIPPGAGRLVTAPTQVSGSPGSDALNSVSCVSATRCVAVGDSAIEVVSGRTLALAEAWNGLDWQVMNAPAVDGSLASVSCVTASACMAVGGSLTELWNGRNWRVLRTAVPGLTSVSCVSVSWCMAVGNTAVTFNHFPRPVAQVWNGTEWRAVAAGNGTELGSVSCVSESDCLAVGDHIFRPTNVRNYAISWNGKRWRVLPLAPSYNKDNQGSLSAVSCVTSTICVVVGTGPLIGYSVTSTVADEWNGREWSALPAPHLLGLVESDFTGLSCLSADHCVLTAVTYQTGKQVQVWNGSTWQVTPIANPRNGGAGFDKLYSISCTAVSACMAVGFFYTYGLGLAYLGSDISALTLAEQWDGGHWRIRRTPSPGDKSTGLSGISCRRPAACVAVGSSISGSDADVDLGESWNGRTWRYQTAPSPGGPVSDLAAVSCPRVSLCIAVGGYDMGATIALAESWNGATWQSMAIPSPGNANDLTAIACTSVSDCIAVGSHQTWRSIAPRPLAEQWNGHNWTLLATPRPPNGNWAQFTGVSCASARDCLAVGGYHDGSLREQPFAEQWNGSTWTVVTVPDTGTAKFTAVDCPDASYCLAVGFHSIQGGTVPVRPLAEAWNGTSWQVERVPSTTGIDTGLYGVSCTTVSWCLAVGGYQAANGHSGPFPLAEEWTGMSWRPVKAPSPSADFSELYSISCLTPAHCLAAGTTATQNTLAELWNGTTWHPLTTKNP